LWGAAAQVQPYAERGHTLATFVQGFVAILLLSLVQVVFR
jgi:hypothetical protein